MAEFRIVDQFEPEARIAHERPMDSVWQQMRTVGMMWGSVVDNQQSLIGYERALRQDHGSRDAAERALTLFAGPRAS